MGSDNREELLGNFKNAALELDPEGMAVARKALCDLFTDMANEKGLKEMLNIEGSEGQRYAVANYEFDDKAKKKYAGALVGSSMARESLNDMATMIKEAGLDKDVFLVRAAGILGRNSTELMTIKSSIQSYEAQHGPL